MFMWPLEPLPKAGIRWVCGLVGSGKFFPKMEPDPRINNVYNQDLFWAFGSPRALSVQSTNKRRGYVGFLYQQR